MFTRSRYRRAGRFDATALGLLLALLAALGITVAPAARAQPDPVVIAYAAHFGGIVCQVLDEHDTTAGMLGIGQAIMEDGLSAYQAGQVLALSVTEICPRHTGLLREFVARYSQAKAIA